MITVTERDIRSRTGRAPSKPATHRNLNATKRVGNGTRRETTVIKRNRTWKIRSLPGYSLASRCTTDRLHVSLRTVTFCHGVLRSARFITAHYVSHFRRDCRGRFLNCQKICHGVHGYPGVLRLPIPVPCVASRLSRFAHGCLKRGRRDRREHSVNAV